MILVTPNFVPHQKGYKRMNEISKEYLLLFNTITDIEGALRALSDQLIVAQQRAEDLYLESSANDQ